MDGNRKAKPITAYGEWLRKRLTGVHQKHSLHMDQGLAELRMILFSDLHKGQRDEADDFEQCEAAYVAALEYYRHQDYALWLLGDVEELWECRPPRVLDSYENILELERAFAEAGLYMRLVGNHDDIWYETKEVKKHLGPYLAGAVVQEGVRLRVRDDGVDLGELFLVHGHQGTLDSDRHRRCSKWIVRTIWRPIQRFLRFKSTTPSNDLELKERHELAMYDWAASTRGLVLIAGHTHHPVWEGLSCQQAYDRKATAEGSSLRMDRAWIDDEVKGYIRLPGKKPYYFNTGCCAFSDSSITGIEIAEGEIRLVRWTKPDKPTRQLLFRADLREVLSAVATP